MSERESPRDPGLQPERTSLAWRRTGLALVVCAAGGLRVAFEIHPVLAATAAVLVLGGAVAVLGVAARNYRRTRATLASSGTHRVPVGDGLLHAFVAGIALVGALSALVLVVLGDVPRWN